MPLRFGHVRQVHLRLQIFYETAATDDRHFASVFIGRAVGLLRHVTGCLVIGHVLLVIEIFVLQRVTLTPFVISVFRHVVIVELIVVLLRFLCRDLITPFFQRRVLLQLLIDALCQFDRRQFDHSNHLYLRRRQFRCLRQVLL